MYILVKIVHVTVEGSSGDAPSELDTIHDVLVEESETYDDESITAVVFAHGGCAVEMVTECSWVPYVY